MEGNVVAGRYVINGVIGSGGMAMVYRGYNRDTGQEVAVKVLRNEYVQDEAYVRRFEKESQIAIKYSHRNIVKTLEVGSENGRHFIVMEYVTGLTLKEYIAKHGRLNPGEAVRIGRQICDALFYAHSHQLIHRDIKPQNILLNAEGIVKVADFGIAKAPETSTVTISGSNVLGSVHYISPEQARGGLTDEKTDIYSIGIVLYEMVTGMVPFTGDSPVAVALKHLQDMAKPPREIVPDIPKALELVIQKAIAKEQAVRYDNAREMARDLERSILEPEGSYIKIRQPDENDGTRPIHPIKLENLQTQPNGTGGLYSITGPTRRPQPQRPENQWRRKKKRPSAINIILFVLMAVVLLGGAYLGIKALLDTLAPTRIELLDFTGKDIDIVKQQLEQINVKADVVPEASDEYAENTVIRQIPAGGEYVSAGETVQLFVSSGKQQVEVPDLFGKTLAEARSTIESASSLKLGYIGYDPSDKPKNTVVRQLPEAGAMLPIGSDVDIWLSRPVEPSVQTMPNVFGKKRDDAVSFLKEMNIIVSDDVVEKPSSHRPGIVVGQYPEADAPIDSGTVVQLFVSNGVDPNYSKEFAVQFDVTVDDTEVKIVYVDGDERTTMSDETRMAGHHVVKLLLDSLTLGDKTVIIYYNDEVFRTDTVDIS